MRVPNVGVGAGALKLCRTQPVLPIKQRVAHRGHLTVLCID
jgi:hypothetical protein